jgi:HEAT repeat protein
MRGAHIVSLIVLLWGTGYSSADNPRADELARVFADMANDLRSPDVEIRRRAVADFRAAAGQVFGAVRSLNRALKDPDAEVRANACRALADIGILKPAVPPLVAALRDNNKEVRGEAVMALGNIGPVTPDVVPGLVQALNDAELEVAIKAAAALGMTGSAAREAVPALIRSLKNPGSDPESPLRLDLRKGAAISLGNIGPDACEAIPALLEILAGNENHDVQCCVLYPLGKIGAKPEEVIPVLVQALKDDKRRYLRPAAVHALGHFGPKAKEVLSDLVAALDVSGIDDRREARRIQEAVLTALRWMGPDAAPAIPAVKKLLDDPALEAPVRTNAELTLKALQLKRP